MKLKFTFKKQLRNTAEKERECFYFERGLVFKSHRVMCKCHYLNSTASSSVSCLLLFAAHDSSPLIQCFFPLILCALQMFMILYSHSPVSIGPRSPFNALCSSMRRLSYAHEKSETLAGKFHIISSNPAVLILPLLQQFNLSPSPPPGYEI